MPAAGWICTLCTWGCSLDPCSIGLGANSGYVARLQDGLEMLRLAGMVLSRACASVPAACRAVVRGPTGAMGYEP